jgi:hypothetical protein
MTFAGYGTLNEWNVIYGDAANYRGYIQDSKGNRFHVRESEALKLVNLLNGLTEALADIAELAPDGENDPAYYLRAAAYDKLRELVQIVPVTVNGEKWPK